MSKKFTIESVKGSLYIVATTIVILTVVYAYGKNKVVEIAKTEDEKNIKPIQDQFEKIMFILQASTSEADKKKAKKNYEEIKGKKWDD